MADATATELDMDTLWTVFSAVAKSDSDDAQSIAFVDASSIPELLSLLQKKGIRLNLDLTAAERLDPALKLTWDEFSSVAGTHRGNVQLLDIELIPAG